jgi:hypothetical protein
MYTKLSVTLVLLLVLLGPMSVGVATSADQPGTPDAGSETETEAPELTDSARQIENPQTANEFLAAFRTLREKPGFQAYAGFRLLRRQAVVAVQAGTFGERERERMGYLLQALRQFSAAYNYSQQGSFDEALAAANESDQSFDRLAEAGGGRYAVLGGVALDRFYDNVGRELFDRGAHANRTPDQLRLYGHAAIAFRRADRTARFSQVSTQRNRLQRTFRDDVERLNESAVVARRFVDECQSACTDPVSLVGSQGLVTFETYRDAREADAAASEAVRLAERHGLGGRLREFRSVSQRTGQALVTSAVGSLLLVLLYGAVFWAASVPVSRRLVEWGRDRRDAYVDHIVPPTQREKR